MNFGAPTFEVVSNVLIARGELGTEDEQDFENHLRSLSREDGEPLVIDMTSVTYLSSGYVRLLATAMVAAEKRGQKIIIKASSRVSRLLKMGGIDKLGMVDVIEHE